MALALGWGFAEATFFFLVPDVCLTFLALRSPATALKASLWALAGAVAGGCLMYLWGRWAPESARAFLTHVPAIKQRLVERVNSEVEMRGAVAILLGPLKGTPYKIYAVEWGVLRRGLAEFLLVSIPARYPRFLLSVLLTVALRGFISTTVLAVFWVVLYGFYFKKFGW